MNLNDIDPSQEQILIVDDEDALRQPQAEDLRILGFRVQEATDGATALALLEQNDYSVLLTDMRMPGMDGFELIEKARSRWPELCVVAMTGYAEKYSYVSVIEAGASDFIKKPFTPDELLAKIKRGVLERNIRRELSRLSVTDSLTGLYNRRHFYDQLKKEILRSRRQLHPVSLILLDLDDFKTYNDTYGHLAGDALLKKVGSLIAVGIREGVDSGYRYGGDEFAVILIDADAEITAVIARRLESAIHQNCQLGVSIGYACYSNEMTVEDLVNLADQRLYRRKREKKQLFGGTDV
jgi:diguanylate cyclase (GGDEF)-like protein